MSKQNRRHLTTVDNQWRKPEFDAQINRYPFGLASLIAGVAAAVIGLMISFVVVIAIWLLAAQGTESTIQVVRAAAIAWQATHLVPVIIGGIPIGILPWGFLVVPGIIIWKTLHWALKSAQPNNGRQFWLIAIYFSLTYGIFSVLISLVSSTEGLRTSLIEALLHTTLIAAIVSIAVLVDFAPSPTLLTDRLPKDLVAGIRPGLFAFMVLWLISAILTTSALGFRFAEIKAVAGLMAPSAIDQGFLTLLSIGYLPTVITWTFSYLIGSGIHLGGSAVISTSVVAPGALPAFPLLSILPNEVFPWAKYLVAIPVLIGVLIYFLVPRDPWKAQGDNFAFAFSYLIRVREVIRIIFAIIILAMATYFVAAFSSGPLGTGFLSFVGPNPTESVTWVVKIIGSAALGTLILPRLLLTLLHLGAQRKASKPIDQEPS